MRAILLVGIVIGCVGSAMAEERILSFASRLEINRDASLTVTETIRVRAEGSQIRRGIFRDFPTAYRDRLGREVDVGFRVLAVRRDGRDEPYHVDRLANGVRVYIGSVAQFLLPGEYTYELVYRTNRQLGFFEGYDELYWNVTGNDWRFPIDRAEATVELPDDAPVLQEEAWTGPPGATGTDFGIARSEPGTVVFETTGTLPPGHGFTVAVAWPKGYVEPPDAWQRLLWILEDNPDIGVAAAGILVILGYYVLVWWRYGKDPPAGTIVPRFVPPAGISPAAARYVSRMKFDDQAFAAAVVNMAVKGYLKIQYHYRVFALERAGPAVPDLSPGEQALAARLFGSYTPRVELTQDNHERIRWARDGLKERLRREFRDANFRTNLGLLVAGGVLSVIVALATLSAVNVGLSDITFALLAVIGLINLSFLPLLRAPTQVGRKLLDRIEGFRLYLAVAERERFGILHPPDRTPELFERYLPYALALDVEHAWSEKFADVLARSGRAGKAYRPDWYDGDSSYEPFHGPGFGGRLGRNLGPAIAEAAEVPGSSSAFSGGVSSGGGFSGGGGGGGGGGGW